jgi:hypothetical protein
MSQTSWFKQAFNVWERSTSAYFDALVRNSAFLTAGGASLSGALTFKKMADTSMQLLLSSMGLPIRRDQERTLHLLQQIEGRLDDLQFQLEQARRAEKTSSGQL